MLLIELDYSLQEVLNRVWQWTRAARKKEKIDLREKLVEQGRLGVVGNRNRPRSSGFEPFYVTSGNVIPLVGGVAARELRQNADDGR